MKQNAKRNRLITPISDKFRIVQHFGESDQEFRDWQEGAEWVREKVGVEITGNSLAQLAKDAGLKIKVRQNGFGGWALKFKRLEDRIESLEKQVAELLAMKKELVG